MRTKIEKLAEAAQDPRPVQGLTHCFYRYPARFSPQFARTAINTFSNPGDLILDPYMGGGTTVVEAIAANRNIVGTDLNSLAAFITKAKTTVLKQNEIEAVREWSRSTVQDINYHESIAGIERFHEPSLMWNLTLPRARFIKKILSCALSTLDNLPTNNARRFAQCVLLRVGQWALDGRKKHTTLSEFRSRVIRDVEEMILNLSEFARTKRQNRVVPCNRPVIANRDAVHLASLPVFSTSGQKVDLVVTSPPYPGVHVLYHRWQVDGRRETPAPYWIAGCHDGEGSSYYNFGNRHNKTSDDYFDKSLQTLIAIRSVMKKGASIIQLIAFSNPRYQLPRYISNMKKAGFSESPLCLSKDNQIWRQVPNRRWHARSKGPISCSRELLLVHTAI